MKIIKQDEMVVCSWPDIKGWCKKLANQLWYNEIDFIIGIGRGGLIPAVMISQYLKINMATVMVSSYDKKKSSGIMESNWEFSIPDQNDKSWMNSNAKILVIDDIFETGATMNKVKKMIRKKFNPATLLTAVLIYKSVNNRKVKYPDFYAVKTEPSFWVRFPWESD